MDTFTRQVFFFSKIAWIKTKYSSGYKEGVKVPIEGETGKKIFYDWFCPLFLQGQTCQYYSCFIISSPHSYFILKKLIFGAQIWSFLVYANFHVSCHPGTDSNAIIVVSIFRQLLVLFCFFTFKGVLISFSSVCSCQSLLKTEQCLFFFPIINHLKHHWNQKRTKITWILYFKTWFVTTLTLTLA